jgi:hypothetical protein
MPTIDILVERKRRLRALAMSRKKGDFITCDCMPLEPPNAAAAAEAKRRQDDYWFEKSIGWR